MQYSRDRQFSFEIIIEIYYDIYYFMSSLAEVGIEPGTSLNCTVDPLNIQSTYYLYIIYPTLQNIIKIS